MNLLYDIIFRKNCIASKMFYDNRSKKPGDWASFTIYKYDRYFIWSRGFYKTPITFISFDRWHIELGICVGKLSFTIHRHFHKPINIIRHD